MSSVAAATSPTPFIPAATRRRFLRRNTWTLGIYAVLIALLIVEKIVHPSLNAFDFQNLVIFSLPLALAAMGQASVVLIVGIDLSVGAMMALVNVVAATWLASADLGQAILYALVIMAGTAALGGLTGLMEQTRKRFGDTVGYRLVIYPTYASLDRPDPSDDRQRVSFHSWTSLSRKSRRCCDARRASFSPRNQAPRSYAG